MKDKQFKQLIKEALTPDFLKEQIGDEFNEDKIWDNYFQATNEYPADTIARVASGPNVEVEWIRDSFDTITDDFGFDKEDLANGIVDGLAGGGFANVDLVRQALDDYLVKSFNEEENDDLFDDSGIGGMEFIPDEDDMVDLSNSSSLIGRMGDRTWDETEEKTPVLVDVWYSYHEEHGYGGVYKVKVHFDDKSVETFDRLKDAEAKYDLEGVEREETEFDVS